MYEYVSPKAMLLSNQKFFRSTYLLLMRVHGLVISLESYFNFSWLGVLIEYVLLWLQLMTLKIHTKECFSVCYCRTPLFNNLSVHDTVCNFKSFIGVERTLVCAPLSVECACLCPVVLLHEVHTCANWSWIVCANPELQTD